MPYLVEVRTSYTVLTITSSGCLTRIIAENPVPPEELRLQPFQTQSDKISSERNTQVEQHRVIVDVSAGNL
jgi:hypothetical protein